MRFVPFSGLLTVAAVLMPPPAAAAPVLAGNQPNQVILEQTVANSDGSATFPIAISDGSTMPLDRQASNADGSSEASADTGILRAKASVNGPGSATSNLSQVGIGEFTDNYIINSASPGQVHVTIPLLVDGSIPIAHVNQFGVGTAGFSVGLTAEAATGSQPNGLTLTNFFTNNLPNGTSSSPCADSGMGTDICEYVNSYDYTSTNSFKGTINIGFDIAANTSFYMQMQLGAGASSWVPLGFPASSNFFDTAVLGGFELPAGDTVTSGLIGPLTERGGVYNYPSVFAYIDSLNAVPEPTSFSLLAIGLIGIMAARRRRAGAASSERVGSLS